MIDGGPYAGKTVVDQAKALGYSVVTDAAGLDAVKKGPVLGLFNKGNMSLEWKGLPADKPVTGPQVCQENQRPANEPSLAAMTQKAIDLLLDARTRSTSSSRSRAPRSTSRITRPRRASRSARRSPSTGRSRWPSRSRRRTRSTLIIVTADHAHSSQIVEPGSEIQGLGSILTTEEGAPMEISYGTAPKGGSQSHTGAQVRVAAQGPQAANVVGLNDQTELYHVIARASASSSNQITSARAL